MTDNNVLLQIFGFSSWIITKAPEFNILNHTIS